MKHYQVELAPEALAHVEEIQAWWLQNRPAAPNFFLDEVAAAIELLERSPRIGRPYSRSPVDEMRRIPLSRTRYLMYFTIDERTLTVRIYAVWHMSRAQSPPLPTK